MQLEGKAGDEEEEDEDPAMLRRLEAGKRKEKEKFFIKGLRKQLISSQSSIIESIMKRMNVGVVRSARSVQAATSATVFPHRGAWRNPIYRNVSIRG